jgi:hypothetical protein
LARYHFLIGIIVLCFSGCASTNSTIMPNANTYKYNSACVVGLKDSSSELGVTLQNSLMRRGIKTYDTNNSKECPADFILKYIDAWSWDIVMYLRLLDIQFYDNKTNTLLANGKFETWGFHTYSSPDNVADELLEQIFDKIK